MFQIAALSPADINYEETLSTLRYGNILSSFSSSSFNLLSFRCSLAPVVFHAIFPFRSFFQICLSSSSFFFWHFSHLGEIACANEPSSASASHTILHRGLVHFTTRSSPWCQRLPFIRAWDRHQKST